MCLLKDFLDIVVNFVMFIINIFLCNVKVFCDWKFVWFILFFKKGKVDEMDNYCLIFILFVVFKVLEWVVYI